MMEQFGSPKFYNLIREITTENRMVPSLQKLCGVKIAIVISNNSDVKNQIFFSWKFPQKSFSKYSRWRSALLRSVTKGLKDYPQRFVGIIPFYLVPLIGLGMLKWSQFLESYFGLTKKFCCEFIQSSFFTPRGTIDEAKVARDLVKDTNLSLFLRYKLACYYFLLEDLRILWTHLHHEVNFKETLRNLFPDREVIIWTEYLEKKEALSVSAASKLKLVTDSFLVTAFLYGIENENVEAIKYCWKTMNLSKKILIYKDKIVIEREEMAYISYSDDNLLSKYNDAIIFPTYRHLLSRNLQEYDNILEVFALWINEDEMNVLMLHHKAYFIMLKCFLLWPYQYLFMETAEVFFKNLSGDDFYGLLHSIVDLIEDPTLGQTWEYRSLLKEFWVISPPHLHIHVIDRESRCFRSNDAVKPLFTSRYKLRPVFLIQKLIFLNTFTNDDELNLKLILEEATLHDKNNILHFQANDICFELISFGDFRLADMFLECLTLNGETLKTFKLSLALSIFRVVMERENLDLADEFVNWVCVSSNEVMDLKAEILPEVFQVSSIVHWLRIFNTPIPFLNDIFKWFLYTENKIEEWKNNIIFNESFSRYFVLEYDEKVSQRLDQFMEWLGYDEEKISSIKMQILLKALPDILEQLFKVYVEVSDETICINCILYLCSNKTKLMAEFVNSLHSLCKDYLEERNFIFCQHIISLYFDASSDPKFSCHLYNDKTVPLDVNLICSPLKKLDDIIAGQEKEKLCLQLDGKDLETTKIIMQ
ncbi:hypothetical protein Anas_11455 [Armadillidium nasatum]|uniref:Uncharacterized protein n=1 Tax=Armadillidium nasatum TaxID=96803 RepID=A0A5N5T8D4_9CRUS|nr:hypothetical protein Anas_11455 [Armadillidium nasatum]